MTHFKHGPADDEARRLAQTEFERPVAVEAGAGTGKTTVLVARILGWGLGRGWTATRWRLIEDGTPEPADAEIASLTLDGIVAITFTEAAAAEMARRVAEALAVLARDSESEVVGFEPGLLPEADRPRIQDRARALIGALDHLAVRTIHSHCWNLLSSYPLAAGLSLDLQVDADGRALDEIVREVVEQAVKQAYAGQEDHPLRLLAARMIDPRSVATAVSTLIAEGFNAEALESDPLSPSRRQAMRSRLTAALAPVETLAAPLATQTRAKVDQQVAEALRQSNGLLAALPPSPDLPQLITLFEQLEEVWNDGALARLQAWSRGDFTKTVQDLVGDDLGRLSFTAAELTKVVRLYRQIDVEALDAGRRALRPLIAAVEEALRARGILTYTSMLTEAWRLLSEHPEVRRREQRKLQQLLVDEFQDTDRMQCELVRFLALGGDKIDRPGLFVVGDPKQSIYGWRDADLEAYENFLEDLRGSGGICVELNRNFRSVPAILQEVDRAIAPVMQAEPGLQPEFSSLEPSDRLVSDPGFDRADRMPIEYWVCWGESGPDTRADETAALEARAIATDIKTLNTEEGVPWGEFGLLLRSTSRLETYLEAFRAARVPFVVTSDKHYYRRREIIEAAALIRTIIVPVDHLALVTFLRSATVGVPDAALLPLWRQGFPELVTRLGSPEDDALAELRTLVDKVAANLPEDIPGLDRIPGWEISLIAAMENLADLRLAFSRQPADSFIQRIRERLLFDVTESARHLGAYRLANLDRFFRDLETALEDGGGDSQGVLRSLRRSVAEAEEAEQALPEGATEDAVQVMTIHGAKGLEFGHVYLPQLHAAGRQSRHRSVEADRRWLPGQEAEYVLFGSPTPGFDKVEHRSAEIERTEQVRTLYVAMTRARNRLVLLGKWPEIPSPVPADKRVTYLDLLRSQESLPESISGLLDTCARDAKAWIDYNAVRWRFPLLEGATPGKSKRQEAAIRFPSRQVLRQGTTRLKALRAEAGLRMARPFAKAASAEAGERLERLIRDETPVGQQTTGRSIARPVGDAFHRLLESWNLGASPEKELARQRQIQASWLRAELTPESIDLALERLEGLIARFRSGQFWQRFTALSELDVAREVPILLPAGDSDEDPVGYVSGFVDLLYRDPERGNWVIVDYKTDHVETEAEIDERASSYALQESVYARAIRDALELDRDPITQLWFIWPDRLWEGSVQP